MAEKKKSSRILTFDLLRGYFLVAIILDHLYFFPNGLDWWSAQGSLYVTTAEGFFFISGIILGIVRGAKLIEQPFRHVCKLLLKRSLQLYLTSIVLVLLFTVIGWTFFMNNPDLKEGIAPLGSNIFEVIWKTLTFQYFYGWADYLRLYAIFLLASPLAMWLLRKGYWYVVIATSLAVWLLFPSPTTTSDELQVLFQPLSWQLLFFGGMTIGFHWNHITAWWRSLRAKWRTLIKTSVFIVAGTTLLYNVLLVFGPQYFGLHGPLFNTELQSQLYLDFFDKERLPITRIALFVVWFWAAFFLFRRYEAVIQKWLGWLLLTFGTNSLYVYTVHAFLIFFAHLAFHAGNIVFNFLVSATIIAIILIMIRFKFLMKIIPR